MTACVICDRSIELAKGSCRGMCKSCYGKTYRRINSESLKVSRHINYLKNYAANREERNKTTREYSRKNLFQTKYYRVKDSAKQRNLPFTLSKKVLTELFLNSKSCAYCGVELVARARRGCREAMSVDRKNNALGYTEENITICCHLCNTIKCHLFTYEDMKMEIGPIVAHRRQA